MLRRVDDPLARRLVVFHVTAVIDLQKSKQVLKYPGLEYVCKACLRYVSTENLYIDVLSTIWWSNPQTVWLTTIIFNDKTRYLDKFEIIILSYYIALFNSHSLINTVYDSKCIS